jgi:hypothetical protein
MPAIVLIPLLIGAVGGSFVFNIVDDAVIDPLFGDDKTDRPVVSNKALIVTAGIIAAVVLAKRQKLI